MVNENVFLSPLLRAAVQVAARLAQRPVADLVSDMLAVHRATVHAAGGPVADGTLVTHRVGSRLAVYSLEVADGCYLCACEEGVGCLLNDLTRMQFVRLTGRQDD